MILRLLAALWFSIITFGILSAIGVLAYFTFEGVVGVLVGLLFVFIACFSGFYVFKTIMQTGVLKFMATNYSSPDLDNLQATPSDSYQIMETEKLVKLFEKGPTDFHGGNVKIWGDWQGRDLEEINEISEMKYEGERSILHICFKNGNRLLITKPELIIAGKTYLKIVKAEKIEWQWKQILDDFNYSIYRRNGKKLDMDSNVEWPLLKTYLSIGEPALMLPYKYNFSDKQDVVLESLVQRVINN